MKGIVEEVKADLKAEARKFIKKRVRNAMERIALVEEELETWKEEFETAKSMPIAEAQRQLPKRR